MSQPAFAPVVYRTVAGPGTAIFGVISELLVGIHEIWTGRRWSGITSIDDTIAPVTINQYTTNAGTVFFGSATQKVLSREAKATIANGLLVDVGYMPAEVPLDPTTVGYAKSTGIVLGTYVVGSMTGKDIILDDTDHCFYSAGFIVDDNYT